MIPSHEFYALAEKMLAEDVGDLQFAYDDKTSKRVTSLPSGGNLTIGIGRNLFAKGLRPDERRLCFRNDLLEALEICRKIFPDFDSYGTNRMLGIANLAFNMGEGDSDSGLRSFDRTIECIKRRDWHQAARNLEISKWYKQVKTRGPKVVELIEKGIYAY